LVGVIAAKDPLTDWRAGRPAVVRRGVGLPDTPASARCRFSGFGCSWKRRILDTDRYAYCRTYCRHLFNVLHFKQACRSLQRELRVVHGVASSTGGVPFMAT